MVGLNFKVQTPLSVEMATQLNVGELRTQLFQRGLTTTGTKATLVRRLQDSLRKESKQSTGTESTDHGFSANNKRNRDSDNAVLNSTEIMTVEKFQEMSIQQLRQIATLRGISKIGRKKELIERLCNDSNHDSPQADEEESESKEEKIVTATKKGSAVLDQYLPDHIKALYHVLQLGADIYDATLNQTNVGKNYNNFYVIQALELDGGGTFMVYNRWGRVGVKGQDELLSCTSRDIAIEEFEQKFFAKTKNHWSTRKEFICYPKSYTWLEMDYSVKEKESDVKKNLHSALRIQPREPKLDARIAKFIDLICNVSMMTQNMMEIGYDANKLPLGRLSKSTIMKGYAVLQRIADAMGQSNKRKLEHLSGYFYSVIPHDFGFKKMREFVIDSPQKLKHKLEMVEALAKIEVATKLLEDNTGIEDNPLYSHYKRLHCKLTPLGVDSKEFSMVSKYMQNTHAKKHSAYTVDIVQIFRASREGEAERFQKFSSIKNRMLLWHGSRLTNWTGILSQGLLVAPPEAPVTGYMFGKGVYFADMFSKSANYCYATHAAKAGVLLLCEVALGDMAELVSAKYDADKLPRGKLSTKGVGYIAPDLSEAQTLYDGVVVPLGRPKEGQSSQVALGDMSVLESAKYDADKLPRGKLSTNGEGRTAPDLSEAQTLEDGVVVPLGRPKEGQSSQVALGDMSVLVSAKYDADKLPRGKLSTNGECSTNGEGRTAPDLSEAQTLEDGSVVPLGRPNGLSSQGGLSYNEYIVYNADQIRMRYVVQVNFNFK